MRKILFGNFYMDEVGKSQTADRLGIDNTPTEEAFENARWHTENILQPIRDIIQVPMMPQSWFRCEELEKVLCNKAFIVWCHKLDTDANEDAWKEYFKRKSHPKGGATDVEVAKYSNNELFSLIKDRFDYDQLIREFAKEGDPHSGWVHVGSYETGNRKQAFNIN